MWPPVRGLNKMLHVAQTWAWRALGRYRAFEAMVLWAQVAGVLAAVAIARSVGPTGRGTIVILTVWGQLLGWLAAMSLDKALIVLTSGKDAVASPNEGIRAIRLPAVGLIGIAVIASVVLGHYFFSSVWLVVALAALAVATAAGELLTGWFLAAGRRATYVSWRLLQPTLYAVLIIAVAFALQPATRSQRTIVMGLAASASMVLPVVVALARLWRLWIGPGRGLTSLLRFALAAQVVNILQYLNGRLDLLALTFLASSTGLGYYSAGAALGQVTILMASVGYFRGITGEAKRIDLIGVGMATLLAAVVIAASPLLIPAIFGASFVPAVPIARILAIGGVLNYALQGACGRLVGMRKPSMAVLSQGIGVAVFIMGIALFRELQGVAWSSVASFAVAVLVAEVALWRTSQRN